MTPHLPHEVIRKQYFNGMTIKQLSKLYKVDKETIRPIIEGVGTKVRREETGVPPLNLTLSKEKFIAYLDQGKHAAGIAHLEAAHVSEVEAVARLYELEERLEVVTLERLQNERNERNQRIYELVKEQKTVNEIAEQLDIRPGVVRYVCRTNGWKTKDPRNIHKEGRRARAAQVEALAKEGYNVRQIAEKLGLSHQTVRNIKNDYGIKTKRKAKEETT